jgi:hypothetical protein
MRTDTAGWRGFAREETAGPWSRARLPIPGPVFYLAGLAGAEAGAGLLPSSTECEPEARA